MEKAVIDGVPVAYNVFTIETSITKEGSKISMGKNVDRRERLTKRKFWESADEDIVYSGKQLDKDIVNPSTIPTIMIAIKDNLLKLFPDRLTAPPKPSSGERGRSVSIIERSKNLQVRAPSLSKSAGG